MHLSNWSMFSREDGPDSPNLPLFCQGPWRLLSRRMTQSDVTPRKMAVAAMWSWRPCKFRWSSPEAVAVVRVRDDGSLDDAQGRGRSGRLIDIRGCHQQAS